MKFGCIDRYKPMLAALKRAGFEVGEVIKQDRKTVITVSPATARTAKTKSFPLKEEVQDALKPEKKV